MKVLLFSVVLMLMACVGSAQSTDRKVAVRAVNYDKSKIAPYTLEDPLAFLNGRKVTKTTWTKRRTCAP